jgi:hypothetical protein
VCIERQVVCSGRTDAAVDLVYFVVVIYSVLAVVVSFRSFRSKKDCNIVPVVLVFGVQETLICY